MPSHADHLLELARKRQVLRSRDLAAIGIPRRLLGELTAAGVLIRTSRGIYALAKADPSPHRSLVEAATRLPSGVVCLLSALRFHELTTQNPWQVWMAIGPNDRKPKNDDPPLRIVRFSGKLKTEGIEHHRMEGVDIHVYSAAKTVVDCFRFRNKIGVDVAVEALREAWNGKKVTADELWRFATLGRVTRIIRPYFESLAV